jgi:uncharacterized LabA/DUF88 family protein
MTENEAERLAEVVRTAGVRTVVVGPEGRYFVVTAHIASSHYTLRDDADWTWLQKQVLESG